MDIIQKFWAIHGAQYDYSLVNHDAVSNSDVTIICHIHGSFQQKVCDHLRGRGCKKCGFQRISDSKRVTAIDFINKAQTIHNSRYDYSLVKYNTGIDKITIICPDHGQFEQVAKEHIRGRGCIKCGIVRQKNVATKTRNKFIQQAVAIHANRYDYSLVDYQGSLSKVRIVCKDHGEYEQLPSVHLRGSGCPQCGASAIALANKVTNDQFIEAANLVHGNLYDYSMTNYRGALNSVSIGCKSHGPYEQNPSNHLSGRGCPVCGINRRSQQARYSTEDFIMKAHTVHNHRYEYDVSTYTTSRDKISIICPTHGKFQQEAASHLGGADCPKCVSRISTISQRWLDSLGIPNDPDHREIKGLIPGRQYIVDGYDPNTNTVYEFHGDYWHGNPKVYNLDDLNPTRKVSYHALYESTVTRKQHLLEAGYNYVEIWESDWKLQSNTFGGL